jgi:flagellar biosynthesis GTPase FlhF
MPVYVGSAFDVEKRNREHLAGSLPFDREMQNREHSAFVLEIVDRISASNEAAAFLESVSLENYWMDKLRTFRTAGCFNFKRAVSKYTSEEQASATKAAQAASLSSARVKNKMRKAAAVRWSKPAERAKTSVASCRMWRSRKHSVSSETRAAISASVKLLWTPEKRAAQAERRRKQSLAQWRDEEMRKKIIQSQIASHEK